VGFVIIERMQSTASKLEFSPEKFTHLALENGNLKEEVQQLKNQLDWFKRQIFGEKSEKHIFDNPLQSSLLDNEAIKATLPAEEKQTITYQRGKHKKQRGDAINESGLRFDESVPVEHIRIEPAELRGPDADQYEIIGEKVVHKLAQNPASFVVLAYTEIKVKRKSDQTILPVNTPSSVFDKSIVDVSFLAGMLVDKCVYHMPLYRQHQKLKHAGIKISRSSLTNWSTRSIDLLEPIYHALLKQILQSKVLAMDETPIKAGQKEKGKMKKAYFWPVYGENDEIAFTFSTSRGKQQVDLVLKEFEGTLLTDGYAAYGRYAAQSDKVTHAQCWVHSRRYFERAKEAEPLASAQALEVIGKIYQLEKQIKEKQLTGEAKLKYRTEYIKPLVDVFFAWCYEQRQRIDLVNSNPLAKALKYATEREHALKVFLNDAAVQPDTNHLESALRVIPMGRKNWLFNWTELGAEQMGMIQSLLVTCKLHDINPYTYLVDVLQRVSIHPAADVQALTPRQWKKRFADNPLRSDLDRQSHE